MKAIVILWILLVNITALQAQPDQNGFVSWQTSRKIATLEELYPNSVYNLPVLIGPLDSLPKTADLFREKFILSGYAGARRNANLAWNIRLKNPYPYELSLMIRLPDGWESRLYYSFLPTGGEDTATATPLLQSIAGKGLTFFSQSYVHYQNVHRVTLPPGRSMDAYAVLTPGYSLYRKSNLSLQVQSLEQFTATDNQRHLWQGLFLGVILVMAFYNAFLWIAVKDISYLHYVLSILGVGLYFAFYYGFGVQYLWPNAPRWDTWCYTIIVPFTSLTRLWFTRTYLNTPVTLPRLNRLMNVVNLLMTAVLLAGIGTYLTHTDWLAPLVTAIGIFNTLILVIMLVAGILAYGKKYAPARYFIIANVPLVVGAIAFILREMGYLPDNWFTRYFVQAGVAVQVIMFALGLASRLNQTRSELAAQRLDKERLALEAERERKQLIEQQKQDLELRVREQTQSLQEQNDKLTQLNAVKDKLFSVLTHDLRNPLATMQSFLKLLTEQYEKLSEEEKVKLFKEAQDSLDHLNRLLFHLLQWSKSQMNLLEFDPAPQHLATALERNRRVVHLQARLKQITVQLSAGSHLYVMADAAMLDFVLRNLLSNAIKFSHKGGEVQVEANLLPQQPMVQIRISDTGVGMQPDTVQEILTTHVLTTRRGTHREKGTGLGLLISREFVAKNSGNFSIFSEPGQGTTIVVEWPVANRPDNPTENEEEKVT